MEGAQVLETSELAYVLVRLEDAVYQTAAEHRLVMKAKDDWERIYAALGKRCPNAKLVP